MLQATSSAFRVLVNTSTIEHRGRDDDQLLAVLHDHGLIASKLGCGTGHCGACTVWFNGIPIRSCDSTIGSVSADPSLGIRKVTTLEGLDEENSSLSECLKQAFLREQAAQCGYCSAGILMKAAALIRDRSGSKIEGQSSHILSEAEITRALDDHLCRCGSHRRVIRAVMTAHRSYWDQKSERCAQEASDDSAPTN
jgi:nicotinate dehydrogenase subunit A